MTNSYYAAAIQTDFPCPTSRVQMMTHTRRMGQLIEETITAYEPIGDVRLLVLPEFAHAAPIYDSIPKLQEILGEEIPNKHTDLLASLAKEYGCFIQTGTFLELDQQYPDVIFNSTALIGPQGILSVYRKVNPWIPWEIHASPHDLPGYDRDLFPVVETEIGRLGVAICYDWLFPEAIRQIAVQGADVINRVSAYMDPWGTAQPMEWWTLINRTRALENMVYVVAANQGASRAHFPPFSWPGGSMIVDYDGRIVAQAEHGGGERVVIAPIHLDSLRQERQRRVGHQMIRHLRTESYDYLDKSRLAMAEKHPITMEKTRQRIEKSQ